MASSDNYPRVQPTAPCNPSCFGSIEDAARMARDTAQRVSHFVNRLCGHEPETANSTGGAIAGVPNGLLSEAEEHTRSIRVSVEAINAGMDRLEKRLP